MGFVSYHEDILKRHESDIHDLIRDLEDGHLALTQQKRVLPEFQWILEQLRSLLSDPSHPVAVRLLEVRSRTSALEVELKSMTDKRNVLAQKNCELADRERHLQSSVVRLKDELRNTRRESEALRAEVSRLDSRNSELEENVRRLEGALLRAQVDRKY